MSHRFTICSADAVIIDLVGSLIDWVDTLGMIDICALRIFLQEIFIMVLNDADEFIAKKLADSIDEFKLAAWYDRQRIFSDTGDSTVIDECFSLHAYIFKMHLLFLKILY